MAKVNCEICNRTFKNEEGLEMHNKAKHSAAPAVHAHSHTKKKHTGKIIGILIVLVILAGVAWAVASVFSENNQCQTAPVTEMTIAGHTNLALHIHPILTILIDGVRQEIPANIGVLPSGEMRPLHTHDATGTIHIEGPCAREFKLGEFFQVWEKTFNGECIFDKCTSDGSLSMTVNGAVSQEFSNYIMRDHDEIVISYVSN